MAKSLRSKTKRAFRAKKREDGVYAVAHAARLQRLHARIDAIVAAPKPVQDEILEDVENAERDEEAQEEVMAEDTQPKVRNGSDTMDVDKTSKTTKINTHGPRNSRREQWRLSKGMSAKPARKGVNRQGTVTARRNAGRPKRRR
ncbi:hypothetical protein BJ322DRAFT_1111155 [Thelephora terrestris]|uniref:DUF2423 domain-containing protein n=1 Tax=Thelephora terrestris TaxID=56493 RepID=A0A9P6H9Y0_9AGAM|nr:hypothetical protein BJ322DRAFT_1111155 [Thelephora terrestris]